MDAAGRYLFDLRFAFENLEICQTEEEKAIQPGFMGTVGTNGVTRDPPPRVPEMCLAACFRRGGLNSEEGNGASPQAGGLGSAEPPREAAPALGKATAGRAWRPPVFLRSGTGQA